MATKILKRETVCVTGAGGFIGSWVVQCLLLEGYNVRGTLRDTKDKENSHLKQLEGAQTRLQLFKADLLNYNSLCSAFQGCDGVFHTASPITNDPNEVPAAVDGTKNVINAAAEAGIRRIVFTSSFGAVHMNPRRSPDTVVDESCWSDLDFCKSTNNWYCYAKMVAEISAKELAKAHGMDLLIVVPAPTLGPMLQSAINFSVYRVLNYIKGTKKKFPNAVMGAVDVRDVARAHVLLYQSLAAAGRYLCIETVIHRSDLVRALAELLPQYPVTSRCEDEVNPRLKPYKFSDQRLKDMGLQFTPFDKTLYDTVISLQDKGHLSIPRGLISAPHHRSSL